MSSVLREPASARSQRGRVPTPTVMRKVSPSDAADTSSRPRSPIG